MGGALLIAMASIAAATAGQVERWFYLGAGDIDGKPVTYSIDDTWVNGRGTIRTNHWQVVFMEAQPGATRDYRFVDRVDCDRELRAPLSITRYDDAGNFLGRKDYGEKDLRWESIANDSLEAKADGLACVDPSTRQK